MGWDSMAGSLHAGVDGQAPGLGSEAAPVYDGGHVSMHVDHALQDLPRPALHDVAVHHFDLLAEPA